VIWNRGSFIANNVHAEGNTRTNLRTAAYAVNAALSETLEAPRPLHDMVLQYSCYGGVIVMPADTANRTEELYVVEVDGVETSEHRIFIEALKRGMELKRRYPRSEVKLRDAG
jgi:hypothetical protein